MASDEFTKDVTNLIKAFESKKFAEILTKPLIPKEVDPPKNTKCRKCGSENVKIIRAPISHWASGRIKCKECGHSESVLTYLTQSMVTVEPLSPEETEQYYKDHPEER